MRLALPWLAIVAAVSYSGSCSPANGDEPVPLASDAELYQGPEFKRAFANPRDNPDLPRVLLIGDSISIGYTVPVRKLLAGKANVHRIPVNGQTAEFGANHLSEWLGDQPWDVIHFNWGLWDICHRHPDSREQGHRDKVNGTRMATPGQYRQHLEKAVEILSGTGAKLIWCTTTPVPEGEAGRFQGDEVRYNAIAAEIIRKHGIAINDLHAHALKRLPGIASKPGDVHFTSEGSAYLAEQVASAILTSIRQDGAAQPQK